MSSDKTGSNKVISDQTRSSQSSSDNVRSHQKRSDQIKSDSTRSDHIRSDQIGPATAGYAKGRKWTPFGSFWFPFGSQLVPFRVPLTSFGCLSAFFHLAYPVGFRQRNNIRGGGTTALLRRRYHIIYDIIIRFFILLHYIWTRAPMANQLINDGVCHIQHEEVRETDTPSCWTTNNDFPKCQLL